MSERLRRIHDGCYSLFAVDSEKEIMKLIEKGDYEFACKIHKLLAHPKVLLPENCDAEYYDCSEFNPIEGNRLDSYLLYGIGEDKKIHTKWVLRGDLDHE